MSWRTIYLLVMFLAAAGFALRLYTLAGESLWYDELLELDIAQGPLAWLLPRLRGHTAVPLDYFIMHFWIWLGHSDGWVRLPAVLWGTLTLPLAFRLAYRMFDARTGLVVTALLALAPLHVRYSQEVRPYVLMALGVTLALYAYWQMRQTGHWRYIFPLQGGILIASLAHIFAVVMFVPLSLFTAIDFIFSHNRRGPVKVLGSLVLTGLLPLVILLALGWGEVLFYSSTMFGQALVEPVKFTVEASQKPNQGEGPRISWTFVERELLGPLGAGETAISLWLLNGLAGVGLLYLLVKKKYRLAIFLLLWLSLPAVVVLGFLVYRGAFFSVRYVIYVLPAYLMLISLGVLALPRWLETRPVRWLGLGMSVVVASLVFITFSRALYNWYTEQDREDWRLVAKFIAQNAGPDDVVIAVKAEPTMNWYYPSTWTPPGYFDDLKAIQAAVAESKRSWVVLSIFSSDSDGRVKAWLSEQQAVRFVLDPLIHVYYLGGNVPRAQLLQEIQGFALPADHAIYASLARENRRRPVVARRYYELAIATAPDEPTRAEYRAALEALSLEP